MQASSYLVPWLLLVTACALLGGVVPPLARIRAPKPGVHGGWTDASLIRT